MPTNVGGFTVFGSIEEKWLALGGVGGLLGIPLSNESPTFDSAGRAQTFRGGVISWHPSIGAHEVHGAILARWLEVGREQFGHPITDETTCPDNVGRFNHFRGLQFPGSPEGSIYWSPTTGPHDIFGAIRDKWASMGFERSVLGYPASSESPTFDGAGRAQTFRGGVISWHPSIGAHEVHGAILARWLEVGREQFGHPITDETACPDNVGRFNHFRGLQFPGSPEGSIYWSPATGPHDIFGAIRDKWASMGFERSVLAYPVGSEHDEPGVRVQNFQGGVMTWTPDDGASFHVVSGNTVKFDTGQVNSDSGAINGNLQISVQRDGTFSFNTHVHDSGGTPLDYAMVAMLVTSRGDAFEFIHKGNVGGIIGGDRDDDFTATGQNPALAAAYNDIVSSGRVLPKLSGSDKLLEAIEDFVGDALKQLAAAGIKAAVTAIVA